jgi:spore coat polysaccharide biosynthesis predicted glycosyltransferase SpsG
MIAIRTNANSTIGIGHVARSYRLAVELLQRGYECIFYVDHESKFLSEYLHPFIVKFIYNDNNIYINEEIDSISFQNLLVGSVQSIVVDDYRFSKSWEYSVSSLDVPIVVLDDRNSEEHYCNILIDGKWEGDSTQYRYQNKTNNECIKLLGSKYVLIDQSENTNQIIQKTYDKNQFNIIISIGGGGDMRIIAEIIKNIISYGSKVVNYTIYPVIGPYAKNSNSILNLADEHFNIIPIIKARNLSNHLKNAHLYIGTAGGTLYEALIENIPSVTFSISHNQYNNLNYLEDLGHFFHLNEITEESFNKIARLTCIFIENYKRLVNLYKFNKKISLDTLGAKRIAVIIHNTINNTNTDLLRERDTIKLSIKIPIQKDSKYEFILVDDGHINRYLDARNLEINLKNMTVTKVVNRLDHFLWWFKSERVSFLLKNNDDPMLYIWHQIKIIREIKVLVGGWFVCTENCGPVDAMYALEQQIKITDEDYPGIPWVAVIKKTNKYVDLLNRKMGFIELKDNELMFQITQECFPFATQNEFKYYSR